MDKKGDHNTLLYVFSEINRRAGRVWIASLMLGIMALAFMLCK